MTTFRTLGAARDGADWSFETARFIVTFTAEHEEMDPAETFEFAEDIEAVRSGRVAYFCAKVAVYLVEDDETLTEVGSDYLGGCAYERVRDFYTAHRDPDPANRNTPEMKDAGIVICHYFPDMVREAVSEARHTLRNVPYLRAA